MDDCCLRRQIRNDTQGQFVTIQTFLLPVGSTKCHFLATTALWHNQRMLVADFAPQWFGPMTRHRNNSCHTISRNDISYNWAAAGENWARWYSFSICKWGESFTIHTLCSTYSTYTSSPVLQSPGFRDGTTRWFVMIQKFSFPFGSISIVLPQPSIQPGDAGGGFHLNVFRA